MPEVKPQDDRISVAIFNRMALIRVEGRGSFKVSTSVRDFATAAIDGGCTSAVFDMAGCVSMDSTFMGVVAGIASRLRDRVAGPVVLLNLTSHTRELVSTLGLDQVVQTYDLGSLPPSYGFLADAGLKQIATGDDQLRRAATMIEAHENLVQLSPENAPRFKDVLAFLHEDLKRHSGNPSGG